MSLLSLLWGLDGLLSAVSQFTDTEVLRSLESLERNAAWAFARASVNPMEAPWGVAATQRGLDVFFYPQDSGADAHRALKTLLAALRLVELPSNWRWPVQGVCGAMRLAALLVGFGSERGVRRHLLAFVFNPADVRAVEAVDVLLGAAPAPARSNSYHGDFRGPLGVRCLFLEASTQAVMTRRGDAEQALFLVLRLSKPVPQSTWVRVTCWHDTSAREGGRLPPEAVAPDVVDSRLRLPSGCASVSVARIAEGSPLHLAMAEGGLVRMILAFTSDEVL